TRSSLDRRFLLVNPKFCEMVGYSRDELLTMTSSDLTHPDDLANGRDVRDELLAGKLDIYSGEKRYRCKGGSDLWVYGTITLVRDAAGRPQYFISMVEDISARKQIDEERSRLAAVAEGSNDAIYIRNPDGKVVFWNDAAARIYGFTREEMLGTDTSRTVPAGEQSERHGRWSRVLRGEMISNFETVRLRRDGSRFHVSISVSPVKDSGGKVIGITTISRDISEQKAAERTLREQEQHFRTVVNSGSAMIWTSGIDGGRNFFNDQWLRFTGRSMEQDAGDGWRAAVHPDDVDYFVRQYNAAFARREHFEADYRLRRADGVYRWIHAEVSPRFDSLGEFLGYIGFCVDVTEKKAAAEELERYRHDLEQLVEA
ncbi:MAG: PAS domain S-box protein, partial [Betaproteobacteria bacterium]|nr:PAS domain S-box protein [Betaproteobacteria bacterium]